LSANSDKFNEIIPIDVSPQKDTVKKEILLSQDEQINFVKPEKFSSLKPIFRKNGSITAATSSSLADGAALLFLSSNDFIKTHDLEPIAYIRGWSEYAHDPKFFATTPSYVIEKLCRDIGWNLKEIDVFEINEAFAIVPIIAMRNLNLPRERVNMRGGACITGHPLGATGARIIVTLIDIMRERSFKKGIASICIGGGEATAIAIEIP
jgi:acetyl-CoA C-acetyltransferase